MRTFSLIITLAILAACASSGDRYWSGVAGGVGHTVEDRP